MRKSLWLNFDWPLLLIAITLTGIGLAMIYSATLGSEFLADAWRKQAVSAAVGIVVMMIIASINYRLLESLQWPLYIIGIIILGLTLLFGESEIGDVRRFIYIGNTSIQPAFPALILLIISQASMLSRNAPEAPGLLELFASTAMTGAAAFLVYSQPNLSTATLYLATWIVIIFTSGINLSLLGGISVAGLLALPILWANMDDYMRNRVVNFLNPSNDPGAYYNIQQALISIGSGHIWGKGFATGTQSQLHFLRVRHTDFIFSVICEELGFIGAFILLGIFVLMLWRLLRIAAHAGDLTGRLIVSGVIAFIFYQLLINVGMNLNVIPVAGLPLPFISSGGSALLVTYMGLGLAQSVAMRRDEYEF